VIVIPAVDVRGGRCVRLREGRADAETVFSDDPVAMALRWTSLGAQRLHVVDLDGAFAGAPRQTPLLARLIAAVAPVPVALGGGLRTAEAVADVLATGARWAVIGTRAVKGWTEVVDMTVTDVGLRARAAGAAALLYTDVSRDGTGLGPNVEATADLARAVPMPILASGGVGSLGDLVRLARVPGIEGTVVGRALYTGAIDLHVALAELTLGRPAGAGGA
jgi:phosphoribosylformimino-5-aminoimidazole carboxamide ribotide isomerase